MEKYIVYKLTSPSGKVYIGRTKDFQTRLIEHKYAANKGNKRPLYKAIRKYGWDNFIKEIVLEVEDVSDAITGELKLIVEYDSVRNGYNATYETKGSGDVWEGLRETDKYFEFIKKQSKASEGKNNAMYGKTHSEGSKKLLKEKAKGRFSLPWFIEKYGEQEGTDKYNERCAFLSNRKYNRDINNQNFVKVV